MSLTGWWCGGVRGAKSAESTGKSDFASICHFSPTTSASNSPTLHHTCQADVNYDAMMEWALTFIIAGDGPAAAGLPTPEEVAHDPTVCQN